MMIPILMYHQIGQPAPPGSPFRGLTVHPKSFSRQMHWLKYLGYTALSMRDLLPYLSGDKHGKVIGLTFDDGYQNVLEHAAPVLQKLGFTATNYIVSRHIGGTNFWDHHHGIPASALMDHAQLQRWIDQGHEIGSHTQDHVHLSQITLEAAKEQILQSKQELENTLQTSVMSFCYPYGEYHKEVRDLVANAGYTNATTTQRGLALSSDDRFELPRVTVSRSTHLVRFLQKCLTQLEHRKRST